MEKILQIINGYKTLAGLTLLYLVGLIVAFYQGAGWPMPDWLMGLNAAAAYTGASLGVAGISHKFQKGDLQLKAKTEIHESE
jgi:hypothetical protein